MVKHKILEQREADRDGYQSPEENMTDSARCNFGMILDHEVVHCVCALYRNNPLYTFMTQH